MALHSEDFGGKGFFFVAVFLACTLFASKYRARELAAYGLFFQTNANKTFNHTIHACKQEEGFPQHFEQRP